jgi:hypothetical protein
MVDPWPSNEGAVVRLLDRHRFPPPWFVEETSACFIVRDCAGQALAHLYYEGSDTRSPAKLLTKDEARRSAMGVAKAGRGVVHRTW